MGSIIVNGDDFGKSQDINDGIFQGFRSGYINRTSIMSNMPFFNEAVELAKVNGFWDKVGLHLNLTEGEPLSPEMRAETRLTDNGMLTKELIFRLRRGMLLSESEKRAIKAEITAQINLFVNHSPILYHLDSHMHVHNEWQILNLITPIAKHYNFKDMRIARNLMPKNIIKGIYKWTVNKLIRKNFSSTDVMGSFDDFMNYYKGGDAEIMVHPILIEGKLFDICDEGLICFDKYPYDRISLS
ncbi:MAG: ChbG/HpnK family deacetylase [Paramuribaculum sp.]|nr:ChbG/HpnK family deacetylase [Paramuribaculum sp.]